MSNAYRKRGFDWEERGRELGETLGEYHSLVVTGIDPVSTGRAAIGIARAQSMYRRVAVGDLFAESPPIQELVSTDDPHGLVDSFLYGVSLSRIAYPVEGAGQLFVIQSGSEAPVYEEILPNPRWPRLTSGFREMGALLVLAVPASAPGIEKLVDATDGAVLVGEGVPRVLPVAKVIASIRDSNPATTEIETETKTSDSAIANLAAELDAEAATPTRTRWSGGRIASVAGIVLTAILIAAGAWLAYRPLAEGGAKGRRLGPAPDTARQLNAVTMTAPDSAARDSAAAAVPAIPVVHNPDDSANVSAYGVELMETNTQAGAILKLAQDGKSLPAATFAPVLRQGARWFNVISGAYASRAEADSLLAALRARKVLDPGNGAVVRLPYAFFIDSVPATAVAGMVKAYADRGIPVYALKQPNGTAWLLAGAFESPESSSLHAESLRASAITPVLVYRKGRTF